MEHVQLVNYAEGLILGDTAYGYRNLTMIPVFANHAHNHGWITLPEAIAKNVCGQLQDTRDKPVNLAGMLIKTFRVGTNKLQLSIFIHLCVRKKVTSEIVVISFFKLWKFPSRENNWIIFSTVCT